MDNPDDYEHSSAEFYMAGKKAAVEITTWLELQDIDLTVVPQSA